MRQTLAEHPVLHRGSTQRRRGSSRHSSDSLKTEEKTVAGVRSHERGTESLSTSRLLTTVNTSAPTGSVSRLVARNGHDDGEILLRKEVIQPHLPVRLPCYDLAPVIGFTLNSVLQQLASGPPDFHGLTGGVYKVRERIHRSIADLRLLAIPTSCRRVAACNPNWGWLSEVCFASRLCFSLYQPL